MEEEPDSMHSSCSTDFNNNVSVYNESTRCEDLVALPPASPVDTNCCHFCSRALPTFNRDTACLELGMGWSSVLLTSRLRRVRAMQLARVP